MTYIRLEEVCKILRETPMPWGESWEKTIEDIIRNICKIPPVVARVERFGEWVYGENDIPHCSECGKEQKEVSSFCPICGAKMEESEEDDNTKMTHWRPIPNTRKG